MDEQRQHWQGTSRRGFIKHASAAAPAILAQTRAPIRICILNGFSGALAYNSDHNFDAMNFYFDSIGRSVVGRKIELIKEDDQANPQIGQQKIRKLVESDKVVRDPSEKEA